MRSVFRDALSKRWGRVPFEGAAVCESLKKRARRPAASADTRASLHGAQPLFSRSSSSTSARSFCRPADFLLAISAALPM